MAQPLTDAINALTRYANETTGASDTTLSDAVETLVAGDAPLTSGAGGGNDRAVHLVQPATLHDFPATLHGLGRALTDGEIALGMQEAADDLLVGRLAADVVVDDIAGDGVAKWLEAALRGQAYHL